MVKKIPNELKFFICIQIFLIFTITAPFAQSTSFRGIILFVDVLIVFLSMMLGYIRNISRVYITVFLYAIFLSVFYFYSQYGEAQEIIILFIVLIKFLFFNSVLNEEVIKYTFKVLVVFSIFNLILSIFEIIFEKNYFLFLFSKKYIEEIQILNSRGEFYPRTSFEHTLIFSFVLIVTLPVFFILKKRLLSWTAVLVQLMIAFLVGKRTGMIISIFVIFLYMFIDYFSSHSVSSKRRKIIYILLISVVFLIGIIFIEIDNESLLSIIVNGLIDVTSQGTSLSLIHRINSIEIGTDVFLNSPLLGILFGNGFSFLINYYRSHDTIITVANFIVVDNSFFTFLTTFGVLNSVVFFSWIFCLFFKNFTIVKKIDSSMRRTLIITLSASIVYFIDVFFFDLFGWYPALAFGVILIALLNRSDIYIYKGDTF